MPPDDPKTPSTPPPSGDKTPVPDGADESPRQPDERTAPETPNTIWGAPVVYMKGGGTTSSAHDKMMQEKVEDAEQRRNVQDAERRVARLPVEQGGAKIFTRGRDPREMPKVLLDYMTVGGEPWYVGGDPVQCLADVNSGENPFDKNDLALHFVCPRCKARGVQQGEAQLRALQSHRKWFLDQSKKGQPSDHGQPILFDGQVYTSAGRVMESERLACTLCDWACHIDKNRVFPTM